MVERMQFDRMKRREFITALGGAAAGAVTWPLPVGAQKAAKVPRIGYLGYSSPPLERHLVEAFQQGLRNIGYVDGQNVALEYRSAEGELQRLPALAAELVGLKVDVIVTLATPGALAAKQATNTIPIVVAAMADPVRDGLVASLSRPGGNVTGATFLGPELIPKRLGLLKEVVPPV
jgi:putative ABC transport system substrate-binding protein